MRSFILICQELGIHEIEFYQISSYVIKNKLIEQWADLPIEQLIIEKSKLNDKEKLLLIDYLKRCEEILRL